MDKIYDKLSLQDKLYSKLKLHKLKLLVSKLKAANSLAVGSEARRNVLTDIETNIEKENKARITQEDKDKLFAITLLLNVLKAKDIEDFNEQKRKYDAYLRSSLNARFANSTNRPAPETIKLAKIVIDEALNDLYTIIQRKRSESPEAEAARARRRAANEAEAKLIANMAFTEARLKAQNAARRQAAAMPLPPLGTGFQGGKKKTRKGRKGSKGKKKTRKQKGGAKYTVSMLKNELGGVKGDTPVFILEDMNPLLSRVTSVEVDNRGLVISSDPAMTQ